MGLGGIIAGVSAVVGVVGAGVGAYGSMQTAEAQQKAAQYQSQVAQNNAITANQNAEYASQAGEVKATDASIQQRAQLGAVSTALAASGVDVNSGSSADVQETQRETGELTTQRTVSAAQLQAYGYRTQQSNFVAQSGLESQQASSAAAAGPISAGAGLLGSASSLGLQWAKMQNAGIGPQTSTPSSPSVSPDYGTVQGFIVQ